MEPRYYDAAGHINYEALEAYSGELRHEAIDAFWSALLAKEASLFAKLRGAAAPQLAAGADARVSDLRRSS